MEYLLVMAFVFVLLIGILILAYQQSAAFTNDVSAAQVQKIGTELVDAANAVYYAGPPTKKTVRLYFPENIRNITINEQTILFTMQGSTGTYEYAIRAATNMTGTLRPFNGLHVISIEAQESVVNITG